MNAKKIIRRTVTGAIMSLGAVSLAFLAVGGVSAYRSGNRLNADLEYFNSQRTVQVGNIQRWDGEIAAAAYGVLVAGTTGANYYPATGTLETYCSNPAQSNQPAEQLCGALEQRTQAVASLATLDTQIGAVRAARSNASNISLSYFVGGGFGLLFTLALGAGASAAFAPTSDRARATGQHNYRSKA